MPTAGRLYLIPSSMQPGEITRVLREGYDAQRLTTGIRELVDALDLDVLFIDTHPGLNEETLLSLVISHVLLIVMRPDRQDFEGTGITARVARELEVPNVQIVVNKAPVQLDPRDVAERVTTAYGCAGGRRAAALGRADAARQRGRVRPPPPGRPVGRSVSPPRRADRSEPAARTARRAPVPV